MMARSFHVFVNEFLEKTLLLLQFIAMYSIICYISKKKASLIFFLIENKFPYYRPV